MKSKAVGVKRRKSKAAEPPRGKSKAAISKKRSTKAVEPGGRTPKPITARDRTARTVQRTIVRIRELDPYRKCGPGTSVERVVRVDEQVEARVESHLVFLDRHGWYCEHGRNCHAVGHARKHRK